MWRARDTRLGREVAIKVLPEGFASDPERVSRLEREARLLATLNHPGIATVHGFEQSNGVSLLVLELVEGPTLAERLRRGAFPIREALAVACAIAEALEAAHDKGVIHRDLKPSNVKVFPDGRVKLLDFGLAKALRTELPAGEVSQLPTETSPTEAGVVLGTAPYMSPEQARGEAVDERTDIWAFGCVLYEMLTGRRAFAGGSASDVIAAILDREPDWTALPPNTPPAVRSVLSRCLKKDKPHRLRHIVDGRIELEDVATEPRLVGPSLGKVAQSRLASRTAAVVTAAVLTVAGAVMAWLWMRPRVMTIRPPTRLNIDLSPSAPLPTSPDTALLVAIAPDGSEVVYTSVGPRLYSRPLGRSTAVAISGVERGSHPFFSPDGRWIGFNADGKLQKVAVTGGRSRVLADAANLRGASWAEDGAIVYTPTAWSGLFRVSAEGGAPERLTDPDPQSETSHRFPQVLPGGEAVLFTVHAPSGRDDDARVAALSLASGTRKVLVEGGTFGRYVPTGHLLYANGGTVFAAPFDPRRLELTGAAAAVLEDVRMGTNSTGVAQLDFSSSGTLVYLTPHARPRRRSLVWGWTERGPSSLPHRTAAPSAISAFPPTAAGSSLPLYRPAASTCGSTRSPGRRGLD